MTLFDATYKCRLCGEAFVDSSTKNEDFAGDSIIALRTRDKYSSEYFTLDAYRYARHHCADGSLGMADFQGFKKKDC